jgi:DNA-binding NarL/FixJ family response regulator
MTILVLSLYDGLLYAQRALRAGAAGYVAKYEAPEQIINAIHQVLAGKVYVSKSRAVRAMSGAASVVGHDPGGNRINDIRSPETSSQRAPNHVQS